jgi:hypothetical protein
MCRITKLIRIERTKYDNSIHGKIGDFTVGTIGELIKEGEKDAWDILGK